MTKNRLEQIVFYRIQPPGSICVPSACTDHQLRLPCYAKKLFVTSCAAFRLNLYLLAVSLRFRLNTRLPTLILSVPVSTSVSKENEQEKGLSVLSVFAWYITVAALTYIPVFKSLPSSFQQLSPPSLLSESS